MDRPICIYCLKEIGVGQPRVWYGLGSYAHRDCAEEFGTVPPRQDTRKRFDR